MSHTPGSAFLPFLAVTALPAAMAPTLRGTSGYGCSLAHMLMAEVVSAPVATRLAPADTDARPRSAVESARRCAVEITEAGHPGRKACG